ncbi:GNAT family N-acetyltransferase [Jannaschia donghaensis]|uniref:Putative N-acetyltransferase YsnE n=1 Tax=Jannaschia donghaensis TaxID=420998 RepID=A0A0M6YHN5_9RHOB|nr:GNAT family N-acetyltransferase [Jannaschia donghaensis]CTQ49868.1 putative N-acetyltransferase YsnE [Jannaschia donghaensis]
MKIGPADPASPGPAALLAQSHALMGRLFPAEANHVLDTVALAAPDIRFVAATDGDSTLGTGAIALRDGYAEVKSMFTDPNARGLGVGDAILRHLIALAAREGAPILRLETGTGLDAAHRLYRRHGFTERGPFGDYEDAPFSLFFERLP